MQKRYHWTKNFSNGDRYRGEAVGENVKDGIGEYYWAATGATYKGTWANDLPHGEGVMIVPAAVAAATISSGNGRSGGDSDTGGYTYEGRFERGQRSGWGTCHFTSGRTYTGEWRMDEMWGHGALTGATGCLDSFLEYKGPFLRGRRHGPGGTCRYTNGDVYVGDWLQGARHGEGEWRLAPSSSSPPSSSALPPPAGAPTLYPVAGPSPTPAVTLYRGAFQHDVPLCATGGLVHYADGSSYTGGVSGPRVQREGTGEHRMAGGDIYTGGFRGDLRNGRGTLRRAVDGAVFEGDWRDDVLDGQVSFRRPRHATEVEPGPSLAVVTPSAAAALRAVLAYTGPAQRGELTGPAARVTFVDGSVYCGEVRRCMPSGAGVLEGRPLTAADGVPQEWLEGGTTVLLARYEGGFMEGRPDGDGVGTFRFQSGGVANSVMSNGGGGAAAALPDGARGLRIVLQRGGTFAGRWSQGLPCGRGRWGWDDGGDAYDGAVAAGGGLPTGEGTYRSAQETYTGSFARGQPSGRGTYRNLLTGETYDGEWAGGLFHGEGTYRQPERPADTAASTSSSGGGNSGSGGAAATRSMLVTYRGSWREGRMSGRGVEQRSEAAASLRYDPIFAYAPTLYDGEFRNGVYEGRGTLAVTTSVSGTGGAVDADHGHGSDGIAASLPRYEGTFAGGARTGTGLLTLADGTTIEGTFTSGLPDGDALTTRLASGAVYTGPYRGGVPTGIGEIVHVNGDRYKGEVEPASASGMGAEWQPQRHGKGTFTFAEGNVLTCTWRHNVLHGEGTYKTAIGEVSTRRYVDGVVESVVRTARAGSGNGSVADIFTAENELPNTLSEDALKRQQQALEGGRKPFAFIRKGEGGTVAGANATNAAASAAPGAAASRGGSREGKVSPRRATAASGVAAAPTGRRLNSTSLPSGSSPSAATASSGRRRIAESSSQVSHPPAVSLSSRRSAGVAAPATAPGTVGGRARRTSPRSHGPEARESGGGGGSAGASSFAGAHGGQPHAGAAGPVRSRADVQAAVTRRMSSRGPAATRPTGRVGGGGATTASAMSPSASSSSAVAEIPVAMQRASPIEAFQEGVGRLDTQTSGAADIVSTTSSADHRLPRTPVTRSNGSGVYAAATVSTSKTATASRSPFKGPLRDLADRANAIRNASEDEIHLLTEEVRVLNEKIWQLRVSMREDMRSPAARARRTHAAQLAAMIEERKGTVERLATVLQTEEP